MRGQNICTQWPNGQWLASGCGSGFRAEVHAGRAIRLESSQTDRLASILSRAHNEEPQFRYMIPDERARRLLLPGLFSMAIRACQLYGEVYTSESVDGGILWVRPGVRLNLERIMQTEFPVIPLQWDRSNLRRCITVGVHLDDVYRQLMRGPHWRILALGVEPSKPKEEVGGKLIESALSRADADGLPCYVETFNERDLAFYKRHHFRIAGGGKVPRGGPDFWAMIRP